MKRRKTPSNDLIKHLKKILEGSFRLILNMGNEHFEKYVCHNLVAMETSSHVDSNILC